MGDARAGRLHARQMFRPRHHHRRRRRPTSQGKDRFLPRESRLIEAIADVPPPALSLDGSTHLYMRVCPSVGRSVRQSPLFFECTKIMEIDKPG